MLGRRLHYNTIKRNSSHTAPIRCLVTLGIRREDPKRVWERRVPLVPSAIAELVGTAKGNVHVQVESCSRRCYGDDDYRHAGARVVPQLTGGEDIVMGIKEPPVEEVRRLRNSEKRQRTWMVFSHTHKGQAYNTALLSSFLGQHNTETLVDYELLAESDSSGKTKRVAAFGWYAGAVGAGEALTMSGLALLRRGIATPLLHLPRPYIFPSLVEYKHSLSQIGSQIQAKPSKSLTHPIVIGVTGAGNVANGVRDMLDALGVTWIEWDQLDALHKSESSTHSGIYGCNIPSSAYFANHSNQYTREDYYANPSTYRSVFATRIAPYLTTLVNGAGWRTEYPRIMSSEDLSGLVYSNHGSQKLVAVQDITCDIAGNLEFVNQHTTIDKPYFEGTGGILMSSIDILPTELPKDASEHFSNCILPYVKHLTGQIGGSLNAQESREISESISNAKIVSLGVLTEKHQWLQPAVDQWQSSQPMNPSQPGLVGRKRVLLLGSGLVAGPGVDVFAARQDVSLCIASNNLLEAKLLVKDRANIDTLALDIGDENALSEAVSRADVVVSLLPAPMHTRVAKHCIRHGKHLVTASYVSPEMKDLHQDAIERDVLLLGECGLDPGIDTMAAMRILDRVKREGKRVTSFVSWCGGLPEPAASNVPLSYKFSWSPRAVLTAALNDARYKLDSKVHKISGASLLAAHFPSVRLWNALSLEGLANRDSFPYAEKYGLGPVEGLTDLFRGTLRYQGFSKMLDAFRRLGLLSIEPLPARQRQWEEFFLACVQRSAGSKAALRPGDVPSVLKDVVGSHAEDLYQALQWLGLLSSGDSPTARLPPLPSLPSNQPIDYLAFFLSHQLAYEPHERDSALLHHSFSLAPTSVQGGGSTTKVTASLLHYGSSEGSAMAVTVGKTLAFAALRVLDGKVKSRGVTGPYEKEVWEGVLDDLEEVGVRVIEDWQV